MPLPSSISISSRAPRYLAILAGVLAALLGLCAAFVYLVDPFQLFRPSRTPNFYSVVEFQIPGVARHCPYNAVVTGTSTSNNVRDVDLAAAIGWRAMNFSIAGSTIGEQRAVLETALATGKTRFVFWGIDPFAFRIVRGRPFPYYMYGEPGWRTAQYLLNLGALSHGVSTMALPDAKRQSLAQWTERIAWDHQYTYGRAQLLTAWEHRRSASTAEFPEAPGALERSVEDMIATLVRAHPGVEFHIVLLPYSVLYSKLLVEQRQAEFEGGCRIGAAIASRIAPLPNARVHDFRDDREITHNLDAFKDLLHFSGRVSRQIIADVAADRRRLIPGAPDQACARIREDATAFKVPSPR